jgi:hypothetical protein
MPLRQAPHGAGDFPFGRLQALQMENIPKQIAKLGLMLRLNR